MLVRITAAMFLLVALLPPTAHAAKRVALVIGNSAYKHAGELTNPKNDATDMSAALKKVGFQVIDGFDLDKASFDRKIRDFATTLSDSEAGLFFYAGHGLQVGGQNYLVPIDAELSTAAALEFEMVRVDVVHRIMEQQASTNIIFLDACRNNPLARNLARAMGTRSAQIGRGLAPVESGVGTLISFSTQPGNVASDGSGRNSPFAAALVKRISSSRDDLSALLIDVRNDVRKETDGKQVPWEHSALTGRFYFGETPASSQAAPAPAAQPDRSELERAWAFIKETQDQARLEEFIKQFGDTAYAPMARDRLEELKKKQVVIAARPSEASGKSPTNVTPGPTRDVEKSVGPIEVGKYGSWGRMSCEPRPLPRVSVTKSPANAKILLRFEFRPVTRSRSGSEACIGSNQKMLIVYYLPSASPVAADHVSYVVNFANGEIRNRDCVVHALERNVRCTTR